MNVCSSQAQFRQQSNKIAAIQLNLGSICGDEISIEYRRLGSVGALLGADPNS